ncbi:MAG TPA: hypothetical protein VH040_00745 [Usitatibacter sp.]|nr:hypothetical protein [Usitatibacter sp.]
MLRSFATGLALCALLFAESVTAATFIQYASEPGPWFWGGVTATIAPPASAFTVVRHGGGIQVATAGANNWTITLDPPTGQQLGAGNTYRANHFMIDPSTLGDIDIQGDGRSCFLDWSDFTVLELVFDASQNVTKFAANVKAVCDEYEPPFYAGIRFNSDIAYNAPSTAFAAPAFIQWVSQNGSQRFTPANGMYTRADGVFNTRVVAGGTAGIELWPFDTSRERFGFEIRAPAVGDRMVPGTYDSGQGISTFGSGAGLTLLSPSTDCQFEAGHFVVYEVEYDPAGHVSKLAADFEVHCWPETGGTFGGVRFNSTMGYTPPADVNVLPSYFYVMDDQLYQVLRNTTVQGAHLQVVDGNRQTMAGVAVRFETSACGSFAGASFAQAVSDSNGVVQVPPFTNPNYSRQLCIVYASIPGTGVFHTPIYYQDYSETEVVTTALPSQSIVVNAGQPIHVGIRGQLSDGFLAGALATFTVVPGTGQASPATLGTSATSNDSGEAFVDGVAGPSEGTYSIIATIGGASQTINVTQHGAGAPVAAVGNVQDMWWNPSENGWGMSLIQHHDVLFGAFYIYDASGNPMWVVMPGGAWDATKTVFTGALYEPRGTPFYAYNAAALQVGTSVGSASITFQDANNATLDYSINGVSGRKFVTREIFAAGSIAQPDRSDLWWGGASQNGWGITVLQQANTLFSVWYTYDANGVSTWYVMPGGAWTATDTYEGALYRTTGSPWVGKTYDPARLLVFSAGSYKFQFNGDAATFTYSTDDQSGTIPLVKEAF